MAGLRDGIVDDRTHCPWRVNDEALDDTGGYARRAVGAPQVVAEHLPVEVGLQMPVARVGDAIVHRADMIGVATRGAGRASSDGRYWDDATLCSAPSKSMR